MGLAGVKKSTRIGIDPRNTKWINNENGIGHKLLAAQGWAPGQGLGDSMKGRTINIKTTYKDDTAGIGCAPQHAQEWAGLSAFNDIFARINNEDMVNTVSHDSGLKNKDRVIFMETKAKRMGLDVRFVKGETFTSELSKAKFLESLGVGLGRKRSSSTEKTEKKAKKLAKLARRADRAERREQRVLEKRAQKESRSKTKPAAKPMSDKEGAISVDKSSSVPVVDVSPLEASSSTRPVHGRFASRAKYQRAKLGSRMDAAQLAEILGVKAN